MSLSASVKADTVKQYQRADADTGSAEVQVALLTVQINHLTEHLKIHKKDLHSMHGLLKSVSQRRKMLKYLKAVDVKRYTDLITRLGLRR